MLRPLAIGIPLILVLAIGFSVGMSTLSPFSPYYGWVIGGYAVLFPIVLISTIVMTFRSVRRAVRGGDTALRTTGRRAEATVIAATPSSMTVRMGGGLPSRVIHVVLRIEEPGRPAREHKATRVASLFDMAPLQGARVPVYVDPANETNVFIAWDEAEGGAGQAAMGGVAVTVGGQSADLAQLSPELRRLVEMGLGMAGLAGASAAAAMRGTGDAPDAADDRREIAAPAPQPAAGREGGRARIEALQPNPDGTYDIDLFVSPKARDSYRMSVTLPVPHEHIARLRRGQYLQVLLEPGDPSFVEVEWDKL